MRHDERGTPPLVLTPEVMFWSRSVLTRFARPLLKITVHKVFSVLAIRVN
jgi:hypothetical protein